MAALSKKRKSGALPAIDQKCSREELASVTPLHWLNTMIHVQTLGYGYVRNYNSVTLLYTCQFHDASSEALKAFDLTHDTGDSVHLTSDQVISALLSLRQRARKL